MVWRISANFTHHSMILRIQTPTGKLFENEIASTLLVTESGVIQVLPRHQDLLSKLKVGLVKVVLAAGGEKSFLLNAGLVRVQKDAVEITSVDGYEIVGNKTPLESYKEKMSQKNKSIDEAIKNALKNSEYYVQTSYLFEEERLAKFELLQELIKGA